MIAGSIDETTISITDDDTAGVSIDPTDLDGGRGKHCDLHGGAGHRADRRRDRHRQRPRGYGGIAGQVYAHLHIWNWNVAQTVTLTAGDVAVTTELALSHAVTGSGEYAAVTADDVNVTVFTASENQDPKQAGVTVSFEKEDHPTIEGAGGVSVALVLNAALQSTVTIPITVSSQSTAGTGDYSGVPATVTFAQGETFTHFRVHITLDSEDEDVEQVVLGFGSLPDGITTGDISQATVTITDSVRVSFASSSYTATEGGADAEVTVRLKEPPPYQVTVPLTAEGRNGADESDWSGVPPAVTFKTGETSRSFTVVAVDDAVEDDDEMVELGFGTLPPGLVEAPPATATLTIMNQEEVQPSEDKCDSAVWCATLTFGEKSPRRRPVVDENGLITSYLWGGVWSRWGSTVGASITSSEFTYKGTKYAIRSILTVPDVPHPQHSWLLFIFDEHQAVPTEEHYGEWTLYVDDVALPFSPERAITYGFHWRHPKFFLTAPGTTVSLRIASSETSDTTDVDRAPDALAPPRYVWVKTRPPTYNRPYAGVAVYYASPSVDGAEDVVFLRDPPDFWDPPGLTGYRVQSKKANDSWDDSNSVSNWPSDGFFTPLIDWTEGVEHVVRVIATYESGESGPTPEVRFTVHERIPPELATAVVDATILTLTYDEALDGTSEPAGDAFTVKVNGEARAIHEVSVDDDAVTLTLTSAVTAEEKVTVSYVDKVDVWVARAQAEANDKISSFSQYMVGDSAESFLKDVVGNYASAFLDSPVTNNTPSTAVQQIGDVVENPPLAPKDLTAVANSDGSVTLKWETADDDSITDHRVSRQQTNEAEGTSLTKVMDTGSREATFTDVSASAGFSYTYFVQAINKAGVSDQSNDALIVLPQPPATEQNRPATGAPTISGTAQVGETLTADTTGIADEDGLTDVSYGYQWLADDANIQGATDSSYALADSDEGKAIKVRVSFTDDATNAETLTSAPTVAVAAAPVPLTVSLTVAAPATHDGSAEFTFEIEFSEEFGLSYKTLRDHAFTVAGGVVEKAQRTAKPSNMHWRITVRPDSNADVTITLPITEDCNAEGAICTEDGRKLSNPLNFTVSGPGG